jgi:hypothetical protein
MPKHMRFTQVVLLLAVISTACGGSPAGPNPVPTPSQAPRILVETILGFEINPMTYGVSVQTPILTTSGMLEAIVPYAPESGAYVQAFLFNNQEEERECVATRPSMANCPNALARGVDPGQQPQRLTFHAEAGRSYRLNVRNRGPAVATGRAEVFLTPDTSSP